MKNRKRILAGLLAAVMTLSMLPANAFAADPGAENDAEHAVVTSEEYDAEDAAEDVSEQAAEVQADVQDPSADLYEKEAEEHAQEQETDPAAEAETVLTDLPETVQPAEAETEGHEDEAGESQEAGAPEVPEATEEAEEAGEAEEAEKPEEAEEPEKDAEPVALTVEGRDYKVTAAFDDTAGFPADVRMKVKEIRKSNAAYQDYYDQAFDTVQRETEENVEITHVRFFDITFYTEEEDNIEPVGPVSVSIKYTRAIDVESGNDISVLHFDGNQDEPRLMEVETAGSGEKINEVSFDTEAFSVYAVIGTSAYDGTNTHRILTVNFYGIDHDTPVTSVYVSENDKNTADLEKFVCDPQKELDLEDYSFYGWSLVENYTKANIISMDGIRSRIAGLDFSAVSTLDIYAVLFRHYTVEYLSMDGNVVFKSDSLDYREDGEECTYTVYCEYPLADNNFFEGWKPSVTNVENIAAPTGTTIDTVLKNTTSTITVKGDVSLIAYIPKGYWLKFDENGSHATYTAPKYVLDGEDEHGNPITPKKPEDPTRNGYSFAGWYDAAEGGSAFDFSQPLTGDTTIYAHWEENFTGDYRVLIWKEKLIWDGNTYTVNETYDLEDAYYYQDAYVRINGERNTIDNETAIEAVDQEDIRDRYVRLKLPDEENDNKPRSVQEDIKIPGFCFDHCDTDVVIRPEGDAILNVYFRRNRYTFTLHARKDDYITAYYDAPIAQEVYSKSNGLGASFKSDAATRYFQKDEVLWFYERMPDEDQSFTADWDIGFRLLNYYIETVSGTGGDKTYNNKRYALHYNLVSKEEWWDTSMFAVPKGTNYVGNYVNNNPVTLAFPNGGDTVPDPPDSIKVRKITPLVTSIDVYFDRNLYDLTFVDGVYIDGDDNVEPSKVTTPWTTFTGIKVDSSLNVDAYKNYVPPTTPAGRENYEFSGWYLDEGCNERCDFENLTMPIGGLKVYARWHVRQYRIFMHPNAGTKTDPHNNLDWGTGNEAGMCFRVDVGERISAPTGQRTGYVFDGWYFDDQTFSRPLPIEFVADDTNTTAYDKDDPANYTDDMDRYGNGATYNKDKDWDRDWIVRKLDLYAKWIPAIVGADGITLAYVIGEGQNEQTKTEALLYQDGARAIARAAEDAIEAAPADKVFAGWILQQYSVSGNGFVDTGTVLSPGDPFNVRPEDAKITDLDTNAVLSYDDAQTASEQASEQDIDKKFSYVVQLHAKYVPKENPETTYIPWYANHDNEDYFHVDTVSSGESASTSTLAIHHAVEIQPAQERTGYKFLGWAKVSMGATKEAAATWQTVEANRTQNLNESNIFLYYNEGQFYSDANFATEVTEIAADSAAPYEAMFAVWEKMVEFTVYHTSDNQEETRYVEIGKTYDLTAEVRDNCLYGGYRLSENGNLETASGMSVTPSTDAEHPTTYYLREVSTDYLKPQVYITYYANYSEKKITGTYALVNVDDDNSDTENPTYNEIGISVYHSRTNPELEDKSTNVQLSSLHDKIYLKREGQEPEEILNAGLYGSNFADSARPCYTGLVNLGMDYNYAGDTLEIRTYFVTRDNVRVPGRKLRMVRFGDGCFSGSWAWSNNDGIGSGVKAVNPYKIESAGSSGTDTGSGSGTGGPNYAPRPRNAGAFMIQAPGEEKKKYTITKISGSEMTTQEVEEGDRTGQIIYAEKDGYMFAGWYTDKAFKNPADFSSVTADMEVYARYISQDNITLTLGRSANLIGSVPFDAAVSVKSSALPDDIEVSCVKGAGTFKASLDTTKKVNVGTKKKPVYAYKHQGTVTIANVGLYETFTIQVIWTTPDGTRVEGKTYTVSYSLGKVTLE